MFCTTQQGERNGDEVEKEFTWRIDALTFFSDETCSEPLPTDEVYRAFRIRCLAEAAELRVPMQAFFSRREEAIRYLRRERKTGELDVQYASSTALTHTNASKHTHTEKEKQTLMSASRVAIRSEILLQKEKTC